MDKKIAQYINDFNSAWQDEKFEKLSDMFDKNISFLNYENGMKINGKEKCLQTFQEFSANAEVLSFELVKKDYFIWKETVSVLMDYKISYKMNDKTLNETGTESWLISNQNGILKLLWRALVINK